MLEAKMDEIFVARWTRSTAAHPIPARAALSWHGYWSCTGCARAATWRHRPSNSITTS